MNAAITKRLLWKEVRTQRAMWLALLGCAVFLQLLMFLCLRDRSAILPGGIGVGLILAITYAAGAGASSFASEREGGTRTLLQAMNCPPALSVTLKTAFALIAAVCMVAAFSLSAWLFAGLPGLEGRHLDRHAASVFAYMCFILVSVLMWTMFCSLLTRKVMSAVFLGAVCGLNFVVLVIASLESMTSSDLMHTTRDTLLFIVSGLVAVGIVHACNVILAARWYRNAESTPRPKQIPLLHRWNLRASLGGGSFSLEVGTESRETDLILTPQELAAESCPRAGLAWLHTDWSSNTPRTLKFLCWREAVESRWMFLTMLAVSTACWAFFNPWLPTQNSLETAIRVIPPLPLFCLFGLPFLCGMLSFRQENAHEQFKVLRDRGVRSSHIWLSKQFVWATRAAILVLSFLAGLCWLGDTDLSASGILTVIYRFSPDGMLEPWPATVLAWRVLLVSSTYYLAGMAASMMLRQSLVAFTLGVCLAAIVTILAFMGESWGVSISWTLLPLAVGALIASWLHRKPWLLEQTSVKNELPAATAVAIALAASIWSLPLGEMWDEVLGPNPDKRQFSQEG